MPNKDDAWKQLHDLRAKYTITTKIRTDLEVQAVACERGVRLILWDLNSHDMPRIKASTQRNVGTMRELAAAIIDACDFVDKANPVWASKREST